jgi:hypothetical protein
VSEQPQGIAVDLSAVLGRMTARAGEDARTIAILQQVISERDATIAEITRTATPGGSDA